MCVDRDEIAGCIEEAYEQIQFTEAMRVLFFSSSKKMADYAKKVRAACLLGNLSFPLLSDLAPSLWPRVTLEVQLAHGGAHSFLCK